MFKRKSQNPEDQWQWLDLQFPVSMCELPVKAGIKATGSKLLTGARTKEEVGHKDTLERDVDVLQSCWFVPGVAQDSPSTITESRAGGIEDDKWALQSSIISKGRTREKCHRVSG